MFSNIYIVRLSPSLGTGKTKTIVAAIEQIVRTTNKNILVCAQSNAACNVIAEGLSKVLTRKEMLRMFSMSYELDQISETIQPYCNLFEGGLKYPSLEYLYKFRVLICTLSTSGCLVRARESYNFNPKHFGYVFIDECASALETMALVPIAGNRWNCSLVSITFTFCQWIILRRTVYVGWQGACKHCVNRRPKATGCCYQIRLVD